MAKKMALVLLCLLLSACSNKRTNAPLTEQIVYVPENVAFMTEQNMVHDISVTGDNIYLLCWDGHGSTSPKILCFSTTDGEVEELSEYQSPLPGEGCFITDAALCIGADETLWITEKVLSQSFREETQKFEQEESYILCQLNRSGKELARFEYPELEKRLELGKVYNLFINNDGDIFANTEHGIAMLNEEGSAQFILETGDRTVGGLILLSDGRTGAYSAVPDQTGTTYIMQSINKETGNWENSFTLPVAIEGSCFDGTGDSLFFFETGSAVWAWRTDAGEAEQLFSLVDLGIEGKICYVSGLTDGRLVLLVRSGYGADAKNLLYLLTPADADLTQDKKSLTYATLQLTSSTSHYIAEFNRTNTDYQIVVTDYSQYGDQQAALTRFVTEIGAGEMPDLIDLYGIPVSRWAANGLLEDLWPYIDSDPELGRDALMERVFQAAEIGGKLYEIAGYFWMGTLTGAKSVVGDRMTWTGADMWKALEVMPEDCIPTSYSQINMLEQLMDLDWSRFVDWERSTCSFESEEFKTLLEFCASIQEDSAQLGERGIYEGQQMLLSSAVTGFDFPQRAKFLLGGDISYVGYPNEWGEVGSSFSFVNSMAMSSACKDKEGAWSFLRVLLLPHTKAEIQAGTYNYFPVNKADFQLAAELAMTPEYETDRNGTYVLDDNGEKIETWKSAESFDGIAADCWYYATTQEEYDQLMALYNAIDTYSRWDPGLEPIITEVAGAYFSGDKPLDETVELIQNRASLYVSEQT